MADRWSFAVGPWTGLPTWGLSRATSRRLTFRLGAACEASFSVDGNSRDAAELEELVTDLWVWREGQVLYRGRVGPTGDNHDGSSHDVTVSTADYRAILARRLLYEGDTLTYTGVDQAQLAWNLLTLTQNRAGGNLGIVRGIGRSTGVLRDRTWEPGETVGHYLDLLANVRDGFEYAITPGAGLEQTLDIYYPRRGTDRQALLDFPGKIHSFSRSVDPGQYANSVRVSGDDTLAPARADASDIGSRVEGRWDAQLGDTSIQEAATLTERAAAELEAAQTITPSWQVTLQPDGWRGPNHIWLGDPVILAVHSGRLDVVQSLRVQELTVALDDSDTATTTVTLGRQPPDHRFLLRTVNQRLTSLERR